MFTYAPTPERGMIVASYPPVAKAGEMGSFFVNTYLLQQDRRREVAGPTPCRASSS